MTLVEPMAKNRNTDGQNARRSACTRKVLMVVDTQNMIHPTLRVDYDALLKFCQQFGRVEKAAAFVTDKPETINLQLMLSQTGFEVHRVNPIHNGNGDLKCNADVEMAFWLGRAVERHRLKQGDMVVICTGDGDFVRIAEWLRGREIEVTVISYKNHVSPLLRVVASHFYAIEETRSLLRKKSDESDD